MERSLVEGQCARGWAEEEGRDPGEWLGMASN